MKVAFNSAATVTAPVSETAVVVRDKQELSTQVGTPAGPSDMDGEYSSGDLRLPRINIVQKVGDLADAFDSGAIILNKEVTLTDGDTPLEVIALRMKKQFQESLPWGSEGMPRVFDSSAEVREAGGSVTYGKGAGIFGEIAHIEFLIKAPAGLDEDALVYFTEEVDGALWARAIYTAAATAYSGAAKPLITARMTHLKDTGLQGGKWELTTKLNKGAKNSWYTPLLKSAGMLSPAAREQVAGLLG